MRTPACPSSSKAPRYRNQDYIFWHHVICIHCRPNHSANLSSGTMGKEGLAHRFLCAYQNAFEGADPSFTMVPVRRLPDMATLQGACSYFHHNIITLKKCAHIRARGPTLVSPWCQRRGFDNNECLYVSVRQCRPANCHCQCQLANWHYGERRVGPRVQPEFHQCKS